jgi:hypothetical protein
MIQVKVEGQAEIDRALKVAMKKYVEIFFRC